MPNKMLIDAAHPEETRVVVLRGNRVEEFDFESASRKQLRGNIYLAKVTRVEPSLQAAFVDYGGNRHGFLAFSEIHPDYYQIPVADRQALIEAEQREIDEANAREAAHDAAAEAGTVAAEAADAPTVSEPAETEGGLAASPDAEAAPETGAAVETRPVEAASGEAAEGVAATSEESAETAGDDHGDSVEVVSDDQVDSVGAEDALEEVPERKPRGRFRQYKIQEVIKRRQVLLVQVVKEERGNKGAALTTYLSLAGRYSVLMPNTARGGGISRKITSPADRKRLKQVATDLEVPEGMGVILRTAGASRTKAEVKRDFEYLLRLWENVRELTLRSIAPTLVYEEGSLIKRSIRDLYNKDIDEVIVAGEDAYREAKDFMRMLMPSHAKNVKPYREKQPLFARSGIEAQLDAMFSPQVTLRSGGYLVINQTEALVSIDVNSGRATREHNIEDTALHTNLEAAEEVARQLRLRDLAGLIVIDFIDMEEKRNNRSVERKLKDALKNDRARIQVGRISHFGLLEMSRQRIRTGVLESTTSVCPTCQGSGHVRAPASVALHVLRSLEDMLLKSATHNLTIRTRTAVALYILNQKRSHLSELEQRFGVSVAVLADESVVNGSHFTVERGEAVERREPVPGSVQPDTVAPVVAEEEEAEPEVEVGAEEAEEAEVEAEHEEYGERDETGGRRRRRRRRRRGGRGEGEVRQGAPAGEAVAESEGEGEEEGEEEGEAEGEAREAGALSPEGEGARRRRRGRRGGRRGRRGRGDEREAGETRAPQPEAGAVMVETNGTPAFAEDFISEVTVATPAVPEVPSMAPAPAAVAPLPEPVVAPPPPAVPVSEAPTLAGPESEPAAPPARQAEPEPEPEDDRPKRSGWWQRRSFF
jgi:ribonuclease E